MEISDANTYLLNSSDSFELVSTDAMVTHLQLEITPTTSLQAMGAVIDPADGRGIPGADVTLFTAARALVGRARTNSQGQFCIELPSAGCCCLAASKAGYHAAPLKSVRLEAGVPVFLNLPLIPEHPPQAMLYGRIADSDGRAVSDAEVCALLEDGQICASVHSNAEGEYFLCGLPENVRAVSAGKEGCCRCLRDAAFEQYPKCRLQNLVLPCRLSQTSGVISGFVTTAAGAPLSSAWVGLYPEGAYSPAAETRSSADGCYSFSSVEEGRYFIKSRLLSMSELLYQGRSPAFQLRCGEALQMDLSPEVYHAAPPKAFRYTVQILNQETQEPVPDLSVRIRSGTNSYTSRTTELGEAAFFLPPAWGRAELQISGRGFCTRYIGTYFFRQDRDTVYVLADCQKASCETGG